VWSFPDSFRRHSRNPPIWPFIYACDSRDVVIVELDPSVRPGVPKTNAEVADRLNEITFGGALMAEMRAIAFVQDLIEKGAITGEFGGRLISHFDASRPVGRVQSVAPPSSRRTDRISISSTKPVSLPAPGLMHLPRRPGSGPMPGTRVRSIRPTA